MIDARVLAVLAAALSLGAGSASATVTFQAPGDLICKADTCFGIERGVGASHSIDRVILGGPGGSGGGGFGFGGFGGGPNTDSNDGPSITFNRSHPDAGPPSDDLSGDDRTQGFAITPTVAPVPEPAGWVLLLLGFGGLGAAARRRRLRGHA